ncbi:MAG: hypothetical protein U1E27_02730, partial [Kiritimatiellia bacterium]|nr:hypothetical protein [Kiritimatiellia bacterium]
PALIARGVFARWSITLPEHFRSVSVRGNLSETHSPESPLWFVGQAVFRLQGKNPSRHPGIWSFGAILALLVWGAAYRRGRRAGSGGDRGLSVGALLLSSLIVGWFAFSVSLTPSIGATAAQAGRTLELTRPVLGLEDVPAVRMLILSDAAARSGILLRAGLGLFLAGLCWWRGRRRYPMAAGGLSLALILWGLSGWTAGLPWIAAIIAAAVMIGVLYGGIRLATALGVRQRPPSEDDSDAGSFIERIPEPTAGTDRPEPTAGFARPAGLLGAGLLAGLLLWAVGVARGAEASTALPSVELRIEAPLPLPNEPGTARATLIFEVSMNRGETRLLLPAPHVLAEFRGDLRRLTLKPSPEGIQLEALRAGIHRVEMEYLVPVREKDGAGMAEFWLPPNLKHRVRFHLPSSDWIVEAPQAIVTESRETGEGIEADLLFGDTRNPVIVWRPRARMARREEAVFFADISSLVLFQPGLVQITHAIRPRIAQGEIQQFSIDIGPEVSVTAVEGPELGAWRFDPEARRLEIVLRRPVSGETALFVTAQIPRERLPFEAAFHQPIVLGAAQSRGTIALATAESVLLRVMETDRMTAIHLGDFPAADFASQLKAAGAVEFRQAYQYQQNPASTRVAAERVLPEIRVVEDSSLDISDERMLFTSRLKLSIAKAGIFSLRIDLPDQFDIDSLTGEGISHWDELREDRPAVLVHFARQALGERQVNIAISRFERRTDAP